MIPRQYKLSIYIQGDYVGNVEYFHIISRLPKIHVQMRHENSVFPTVAMGAISNPGLRTRHRPHMYLIASNGQPLTGLLL
jgi:hypothetical protein